MANTENKKPINIKLAAILILSAAVIVFLARLVIMKIRYEHHKKKRRKRLKYYRETNFQNLELTPKSRKYR